MDFSEKIEARLASIESKLTASKDVLTLDEVAAYTGLSKSYLYKLTANKRIPHYKPLGKLCFFNRAEVEAWLQARAITTADELEAKATHYLTLKQRGVQP